ncbi:site-2 protease family protein [Bacillota bacterium]
MKRFLTDPAALLLILFMAYQAIRGGRYDSPMDWLMGTLTLLPGIIIGLSFHEFAHAAVAYKCGDPTPKQQKRVTISPAAHIDPMGFIALIFIGFGWGKPVMINPHNFRKPRRDELLVSLAGVTMNLVLAFLILASVRLLYEFALDFMLSDLGAILQDILMSAVFINIVLLVFNLLPIPPLDGFNVLTQIFNLRNTEFYYRVYDKGFIILMILILFNVTGRILTPAVSWIYSFMAGLLF